MLLVLMLITHFILDQNKCASLPKFSFLIKKKQYNTFAEADTYSQLKVFFIKNCSKWTFSNTLMPGASMQQTICSVSPYPQWKHLFSYLALKKTLWK